MDKFILTSLLSYTCLLFSCNSLELPIAQCHPFCEEEEWYVEEVKVDGCTLTFPSGRHPLISAMLDELYFWQLVSPDTLMLNSKARQQLRFRYERSGDTIMLASADEIPIKLVIIEEANSMLRLKTTDFPKIAISLQKRN